MRLSMSSPLARALVGAEEHKPWRTRRPSHADEYGGANEAADRWQRLARPRFPRRRLQRADVDERTPRIQRRREVVDLAPGDAQRAVFDIDVELRTGRDGRLEPRGPYVQGRPGERFIYLSWGAVDGAGHSRCSDASSCGSVGSMSSCCGVPTRLDTGSSSGRAGRRRRRPGVRLRGPGAPGLACRGGVMRCPLHSLSAQLFMETRSGAIRRRTSLPGRCCVRRDVHRDACADVLTMHDRGHGACLLDAEDV